MHSKSDSTEVMINDEADEAIEELFKSLLYRYQNNLEKLMRVSKFAFDYVHFLYRKCHKNPIRGRSYTDSSDWIRNKKATINTINKKDIKCFQYVGTVSLNHKEIKNLFK